MNKLLSAALAIGMLLAVSGAQAAEVLSDENLDAVTAGATLNLGNGSIVTAATGTTAASFWNNANPFSTAANGGTLVAVTHGCPCSLTLP